MSSYSLAKIEDFCSRALSQSPEDWASIEDGKFPVGKNPWSNLYSDRVVQAIGKTIGLEGEQNLLDLRLLLAFASENCFKVFSFVGGAAADGKKRDWRKKAIANAKRLKATLVDADDEFPAFTKFEGNANAVRIYPGSATRQLCDKLLADLGDFLSHLEDAEKALEVERYSTDAANPSVTQHKQYLQCAVDQFTAVFVHFRGIEAVKRSCAEEVVYGEFPDFVREAANPTLSAYYLNYANNPKRPSKLDAQIQEAVKKASRIMKNLAEI